MNEIGGRTSSAIGDQFGPPTEEHRLIPEITYDEQLYPARPRRLRPSARRVLRDIIRSGLSGATDGDERRLRQVAGRAVDAARRPGRWPHSSRARGACGRTRSPIPTPAPPSSAPRSGSPPTRSRSSRAAASRSCPGWPTRSCGGRSRRSGSMPSIPGPVKLAGGINGWSPTGSVDGHFDRISMQVDPVFGTEDQFRALCAVAAEHDGHCHRRHRPRPHRQGSGFPAGRDGLLGLSRHLPHGVHRSRGLAPAARRRPTGRDSVNLDAEAEAKLPDGRLHHRPAAAGDLLRARGQGDQLERDRGVSRASTASSGAGSTCTTSRPASHRSTGWTRPSPGCAWSSATRCTRSPISAPARCGWTPTGSSASRRAPRTGRHGLRAIRCRRPPTSSSPAWSARWAASPSRSST